MLILNRNEHFKVGRLYNYLSPRGVDIVFARLKFGYERPFYMFMLNPSIQYPYNYIHSKFMHTLLEGRMGITCE